LSLGINLCMARKDGRLEEPAKAQRPWQQPTWSGQDTMGTGTRYITTGSLSFLERLSEDGGCHLLHGLGLPPREFRGPKTQPVLMGTPGRRGCGTCPPILDPNLMTILSLIVRFFCKVSPLRASVSPPLQKGNEGSLKGPSLVPGCGLPTGAAREKRRVPPRPPARSQGLTCGSGTRS
jgi:hypothetical protein